VSTHVDLSAAEQAFFVSNSPLFLLRKLMEDAAVGEIARTHSADDLLSKLREAATAEPVSLKERVWPFVLLVALALKSDVDALQKTTDIRLRDGADWFDYIRDVLMDTYRPTVTTVAKGPIAVTHEPWRPISSTASNTSVVAEFGGRKP
jgi:hypothetical protein